MKNLQVTLAYRPKGMVQESDMALATVELPALEDGQNGLKALPQPTPTK